MVSTTNKTAPLDWKKENGALYVLLSFLLLIILWQILSWFLPPLVVPSPWRVLVSLGQIITAGNFFPTVLVTVGRLLVGLFIGVLLGALLGMLLGFFGKADALLSPWVVVLQAVPPVCWVVLALVWFGFNGKPCVFIVATASIPPMAINLKMGIKKLDTDLLEMADLYRLNPRKRFFDVLLPQLRPYFDSACETVITGGWKMAVMGEVLTTSTGIGGKITSARLNIEPEAIMAWALLLVLFSYLTSLLLKLAFRGRRRKKC